MHDYAVARHNMVESQIRANNVTDPAIVDAFQAVPRELFVPKQARGIAYVDEDLPLGGGRFLMEPMVFARLLMMAEIGPDDLVLDVGGATGYGAAVLARLAAAVVAVEENEELAKTATETLSGLGVDNAVVVEGPLTEGYPKQAPYNVIVIEGGVEEIPSALREQLADGGRLVAVVRSERGVGKATLFQSRGGGFSGRAVFDAATPEQAGFAKQPGFVF